MMNLFLVFAEIEMGFFSWKTNDTDESIANKYSEAETFEVWMIDNEGNTWHEPDYDGYGVFGGKPFYELMGEMNGISWDEALNLESRPDPNTVYPNLTRRKDWTWVNECPKNCPDQGYFYATKELPEFKTLEDLGEYLGMPVKAAKRKEL
jgi:hypothetical protein